MKFRGWTLGWEQSNHTCCFKTSPEQEQRLKTFSHTKKGALGKFSGSEWLLLTNWESNSCWKGRQRGPRVLSSTHTTTESEIQAAGSEEVKWKSDKIRKRANNCTGGFCQSESLWFLLQVVVDFGEKKKKTTSVAQVRFRKTWCPGFDRFILD